MSNKKFVDKEIMIANEVLDMLDFFNQRAGRELWNKKTVAVQDEDIRRQEKILNYLKILSTAKGKKLKG